jgi:alkaline phosphatase D
MKQSYLLGFFTFLFFTSLFAQEEARTTLKAGQAPFFHGVASGDPMSDKVMLWTKVTPPNGNNTPIDVYWQIATDLSFTNIVNFGSASVTDATDYTLKIDVCGLQPATYYYYAFKSLGSNSVIGRTKTAPATGGAQARFAVASCSSYEHGYFNAYENMAGRNDLDAIIHLGDYIYEYETGGYSTGAITGTGRTYLPTNEIITLSDYRIRHSHYKLDDQLQRAHQIHPFITTWDDHETANDSYKDGAENHSAAEGSWQTRKISGVQAYAEYMPLRNPDPNDDLKIWRKLRYGSLLDLIVIDSRLWGRDQQNLGSTNNSNRTILGSDQFTWFESSLSDNGTQWKIICNQVMMAPLQIFGQAVNADQWDGYNSDRNRFLNYITTNNLKNNVVLTGDIHTAWVNNIPNSSNSAAEFVVTSITSPGLDFLNGLGGLVSTFNPHVKYLNLAEHGYLLLTVNQQKTQGDFVFVDIDNIDTTSNYGPSWQVNLNNTSMVQSAARVAGTPGPPIPPLTAVQNLPFALLLDTFEITVSENTFANSCFITVQNACPTISTSVLSAPSFGTATVTQFCTEYEGNPNYYGMDYMTIAICQTANPLDCDTSIIAFTILPSENADTLSYNILNDSLLADCFTFNDLYASANSVSYFDNGIGSFTLDTATNCFTYTANGLFNGIHYISIYACDSFNVCDTTVLQINLGSVSNNFFVELFGEPEELLSSCIGFDDLLGTITSSGIQYSGTNNALIFNDSCISYTANANFTGIDTVVIYGCDNSNPQICDTIYYYITITEDTTSIREITQNNNTDFAVLGVYPNPFDVEILVQYYQFSKENISITLYDIAGKQIFADNIGESTEGLKYARLETEALAKGTYILEFSTANFSYSEKLVKY